MVAIALYVVALLCLVGGVYLRGLLMPELIAKSGFPVGSPVDSLMFELQLSTFHFRYMMANGAAAAGLLSAILFAALAYISQQLARVRGTP